MVVQVPFLAGDIMILPTNVVCVVGGGIVAAVILVNKWSQRPNLDAIPTVGSTNWLQSWWAGFKFTINGAKVIREGYEKYKSRPFKVADYYRWMVIVNSREHIDELQRASDDEFSLTEATNDRLHMDCLMRSEVQNNRYHISLIPSKLTRNIGALYLETKDEIDNALDEILDLEGNEWKSVTAVDLVEKVVFRTTNRAFVGLPLCRNPDWMNLNIRYAFNIMIGVLLLELFPAILASFVARFLTFVPHTTRKAMRLLGPIIEERQKHLDEEGSEWADKPNDFLSWMMDEAEGEERGVELLTTRMLSLNLAALHTTSNSFTQALFYLAANPQYVPVLREEVQMIVDNEGWSKASLAKMHKIDSFLKESQRIRGFAGESLARKAMKDYTFSDGTFIPKGTMITVASPCLHLDDELYDNATVFDPFRFAHMREADGEGTRHQFTSTSVDYLSFGHGRHACPGRFFAANILTSMLAQIVLSYDVRLENATLPDIMNIGTSVLANRKAKVMFKRRTH